MLKLALKHVLTIVFFTLYFTTQSNAAEFKLSKPDLTPDTSATAKTFVVSTPSQSKATQEQVEVIGNERITKEDILSYLPVST